MAAVMSLLLLFRDVHFFFSIAWPALILLFAVLFTFFVFLPIAIFIIAWLGGVYRSRGVFDDSAKRVLRGFESVLIVTIGILLLATMLAVLI